MINSPDLSTTLSGLKAADRLKLLHDTYGERLVASTSFGLQAAVMIHLIHHHAPEIPVVFIDTGYLFPETYHYIDELMEKWPIDLRTYTPRLTAARQEALYGKLWETDLEKYATINKVEPMNRALTELGADVWLSGLRRSQSSTRAERPFAEQQKKTLKVYPILDWADAQVDFYMRSNNIPAHPLAHSYVTMGDWHSTAPAEQGMTAEATRYGGQKYECGLHEVSAHSDFQI